MLKNGVKEEQVQSLDKLFIEKNISPGGCADLLALCFFVYFCHQGKGGHRLGALLFFGR